VDRNLEAFARLLYRGNEAALRDLDAALADWKAFYGRHAEEIGVDLPYLKEVWEDGAMPWDVVIDIGDLHRFLFEADGGEFFEEIVAGLRELVPGRPLKIDWDTLAATDIDTEIEEFFSSVQAQSGDEVLVIVDKASDSYPLAFLPRSDVARAQQLAKPFGEGRLEVAGG
jgi:hypothetical protein